MSSAILTYLVTLLSDAWPTLATTIQVSVGGGTSSLDPLELGDAVRMGGGACPWGCGTVHVTAVRGMATLVATADDATLQLRNCGGTQTQTQAAVLTLPITIPQLQADVALAGTVLGLGIQSNPTLTAQNVGGTLTVTLPIIAGSSANTYALEPASLTANLYLDLQQVSNVAGAPGLAQPLANDVLRAGLAPVFARLASNELTTLLSNFLASKLGSVGLITLPAFLLPGISAPPAPPQPCTAGAAFTTPCDPCDTCCLCATQSRCADAACTDACGACMPAVCKSAWSWSLILAAVVSGLVVAAILGGVGFGLYKLTAVSVRALQSKGKGGGKVATNTGAV